MNMKQKHECFGNALTELPTKMTIKDILIFVHGLCGSYDVDPHLMALGLMATNPSDEEEEEEDTALDPNPVEISFTSKKLQQLLGK